MAVCIRLENNTVDEFLMHVTTAPPRARALPFNLNLHAESPPLAQRIRKLPEIYFYLFFIFLWFGLVSLVRHKSNSLNLARERKKGWNNWID